MGQNTIYEDGSYLSENPTWHEEDSSWKARQIKKILQKYDIISSSVGEIGCGAGEILNCLAKEYGDEVNFSGYDISPQAIQICKKKERKNLHFFLKDILEENDSYFDILMAIDVIEHVEDYFGLLRKIKNKATYKIFHFPLDLSVQMVLRSWPILKLRSSVGHIHYFTKELALATLKDTGYEIIDNFYTPISLELKNLSWKAHLLKPFRKLLFFINQDLAARMLGGYYLMVLAK